MLSLSPPVIFAGAGLCAIAVRLVIWRIRRAQLPPSPPAHPIYGHVDLIKSPNLHITAADWVRKFGDMVTLHFMDKNIVIINSAEAATELLEKRAASTSGRQREVMMGEVMGYNTSVGLHQPDERFRKLRRVMASAMHSTAVRGYQSVEVENVAYMLRRMAGLGGAALTQPSQAATRFILRVAYGYDVKPHDPFINLIHAAMMKVREGRYPLVEAFPWLVSLPSWLPGTRFLKVGAEGRELREAYAGRPFECVKSEMRAGTARPSFVSNLLNVKGGPDGASAHDQDLIKWTAAALFVGGGDTTVAAINTFLLMMAANPEVQRQAQAEVLRAVGKQPIPLPARLPGFGDRVRMPYLEAVFKEVMRFNPGLSMGLPHVFTQEESYRGYVFPVGTVVRANIWGILHDPILYPNPHAFLPSRHLGLHAATNPLRYVFGFGRRVCPGVHLATDQPWLAMAGILAAFDVIPGKGLKEAAEKPWEMFEFNGMTR
ncbi:cytochrome P450 [Ceratobasidium sp. AG-I]|nr:cytochrome P450 [Ceratobasidium sp. AG-I]